MGHCDALNEYFGNFPRYVTMGLASDAIFSTTETQMAIQTEVTLQPDYTCCLRVMGNPRPLARRTFQTCRDSSFYLSLARTGHLDICQAIIFQIVLARTMTNHSMYFSRGRPPTSRQFFCVVFLLQRDASVARVGVGHVNQTH